MLWADRLRAVPCAIVALLAGGIAWLQDAAPVLAASPSPAGAAGGDPRSSGQGPGLVGDPLLAIVVVVLIAVATIAATLAYIRMTGGSRQT